MSERDHAELPMSFVTLASEGGPHEDSSYLAGWQMGALNALLALDRDHLHVHEQMVYAASREQAELIAVTQGYAVEFTDSEDPAWLSASFTRQAR